MLAEPVCLEVRDLRVSFASDGANIAAVDGISFCLRRGKTLALVGESGCGKSATAHALLRLIQPPGRIAGGQIMFRPRQEKVIDVLGLSARSEDLYRLRGGLAAMIFQEPQSALSPVHDIGSQLCEGIRLHRKMSRRQAEELAMEMLTQLGISNPLARMSLYPHELSGGMRQRVVIAMALLCNPQVLIADEPTTALDEPLRRRVFAVLRSLRDRLGMAVLLITHDLTAVAKEADDIAVMYCGQIVEQGPAQAVLAAPRHPYTRALLESVPTDAPRRAGRRLPTIAGAVPEKGFLPQGCSFHPRCRDAELGVCDAASRPGLQIESTAHAAACFKAEELLGG